MLFLHSLLWVSIHPRGLQPFEQDLCARTRGAPLLDGFLHAGFPLSQLREDFKTNRRAILFFLPLLTTRDKECMVRRVGFEPTVFTLRVADLQSAGLAN